MIYACTYVNILSITLKDVTPGPQLFWRHRAELVRACNDGARLVFGTGWRDEIAVVDVLVGSTSE